MNQPSGSPSKTAIAQSCLEHLDQEIRLLQHYLTISNEIQDRVGAPSTDDGGATENHLEGLSEQTHAVASSREQLRQAMARYLDVPVQQATVRRLAGTLDSPDADSIREKTDQLVELEATIQSLHRTNSLLVRQTIDIYQKIAVGLSHPGSDSVTYSPSGQISVADHSGFLQTDC